MAMDFYYGSGSPYAWRVWLALEHKRLPYTLHTLSFSAGEQRTPEFAALNPRCKVPVLVDAGVALRESVAILEYLDDAYPGAGRGRIYPNDLLLRSRARRMIEEVDNYLRPSMETLLREVLYRSGVEPSAGVVEKGRGELAEELQHWEAELAGGDFLCGAVGAADFALYPMIALALRIDVRRPGSGVREAIPPRIASWMSRVEALPYFASTVPPHWR